MEFEDRQHILLGILISIPITIQTGKGVEVDRALRICETSLKWPISTMDKKLNMNKE